MLGRDIALALDVAATEFYSDGSYSYEGKKLSAAELSEVYAALVDDYPLISIEDPLAEDDWDGWVALTDAIGTKVQLVGDDLFVTNPERIKEGIKRGSANSVLVKVNQIGSITETLEAVETAHRTGWTTITSHRSGETEDTFIADLAVATRAGQIKTGSLARTDRVAKYNRLLKIELELGSTAIYPGASAFRGKR